MVHRPEAPRTLICENRRARHAVSIAERHEAGLVLLGTEVKACRAGLAHLNEAFIQVQRGVAVLVGAHIGEYSFGNQFNHVPLRARTLLLHARQILRLYQQLQREGQTAVPLSLYFRDGRIKLEFGVGRGNKAVDKRHVLKERDAERDMRRHLVAAERRPGSRNS